MAVDPLATFFSPMVNATADSMYRATHALDALTLRPAARGLITVLEDEVRGIDRTADEVHRMLACDRIHGYYMEAHTAMCCDIAYALNATWMIRLVTIVVFIAALIASVAGYKRFRRKQDLWGPYASIEALEVGSYL